MAERYSICVSHEVVREDGTKLWDDEYAFHNATAEATALVENTLSELNMKLKAMLSDGLRDPVRQSVS